MPVRIVRRDCPPSRPQFNCWAARRLMKLPACRSGCVGPVWLWVSAVCANAICKVAASDQRNASEGLGHGHHGNVGCRPDETSTVVADTHGSGVSSPANAGGSSIEEIRWTRELCARAAHGDLESLPTSSRVQSRDACECRFFFVEGRLRRALRISPGACLPRALLPTRPSPLAPGDGRALRSIRPGR